MTDLFNRKVLAVIIGMVVILATILPVVYKASYDIGRNAAKREIIRNLNDSGTNTLTN